MFSLMKLITKDTNFDFVGKRRIAYIFSAILVIASINEVAFKGLNYGIDFSGGILMEVKTPEKADMSKIRTSLEELNVGEFSLQGIGDAGDQVMIRVQASNNDEQAQNAILQKIKDKLGNSVEYRRVELVGPKVGDELIRAGIWAVVIAIGAIGAYIWFRFELPFALGGIIALFHDVITTVGILSLLGMDFSLDTVAAILTIAGYSINDTVVCYDRIRENIRKHKKMPILELVNNSINEMLSRTILTGFTTFLAVIAILIFGGPVLRSFSFALAWGIFIGTYSSVYVASTIVTMFDIRKRTNEGIVGPYDNVE